MLGREGLPMPWKETCAMDERMRFVLEVQKLERPLSELCREFGISRKSGYKWLERYKAAKAEGLKDRSRAPLEHGRQRPAELVEAVFALRERYPWWGPRKLRFKLRPLFPDTELPAASTI